MANGYEIRGVRKFILALVFAVGAVVCSTTLCWSGKISGEEYTDGLDAAGLTIAAVCAANAAQKFARKE